MKCPPFQPFLVFRVKLMHGNLCLHTLYVGRGVGDYSKQLIAAEKCIVESEKLIERLEKKY